MHLFRTFKDYSYFQTNFSKMDVYTSSFFYENVILWSDSPKNEGPHFLGDCSIKCVSFA